MPGELRRQDSMVHGRGTCRDMSNTFKRAHSHIYSWPLVAGEIPVALSQYVFSTTLLSSLGTKRGCWPDACRCDWMPSRMPIVAATGRARKPKLDEPAKHGCGGVAAVPLEAERLLAERTPTSDGVEETSEVIAKGALVPAQPRETSVRASRLRRRRRRLSPPDGCERTDRPMQR